MLFDMDPSEFDAGEGEVMLPKPPQEVSSDIPPGVVMTADEAMNGFYAEVDEIDEKVLTEEILSKSPQVDEPQEQPVMVPATNPLILLPPPQVQPAPIPVAAPKIISSTSPANPLDKTVCLIVTYRNPGNTKKVKVGTAVGLKGEAEEPTSSEGLDKKVEAEKRIRAQKVLFDHDALKNIGRFNSETRQWIEARTLEGLKDGIYILPLGEGGRRVKETIEYLKERYEALKGFPWAPPCAGYDCDHVGCSDGIYKRRAQKGLSCPQSPSPEGMVEKFLQVYPSLVYAAKADLEPFGLWNPLDFPSLSEMRRKFDILWRVVSFATPSSLMEMNSEIWAAEEAKAKASMQSLVQAAEASLYDGFSSLVVKMRDLLLRDGKVFSEKDGQKGLLGQFKEFLGCFADNNITGNASLASLVEKAKGCLDGVVSEDLKTLTKKGEKVAAKPEIKAKVLDTMSEIASELETFAKAAPQRVMHDDLVEDMWE